MVHEKIVRDYTSRVVCYTSENSHLYRTDWLTKFFVRTRFAATWCISPCGSMNPATDLLSHLVVKSFRGCSTSRRRKFGGQKDMSRAYIFIKFFFLLFFFYFFDTRRKISTFFSEAVAINIVFTYTRSQQDKLSLIRQQTFGWDLINIRNDGAKFVNTEIIRDNTK